MKNKTFKNYTIWSKGRMLLLLAAIVALTFTTRTIHAAGCSAVNFSITFRENLHTIPNGSLRNEIATADFNRDGNLDMAVANFNADLVNIFLGNGNGGFTGSTLTPGNDPREISTGDFNRDGKADLLVLASNITIFNGNGNGGFTLAGAISDFGLSITVSDFNLDGKEDFAISSSGSVRIYPGNGNGTFASPISTIVPNVSASKIAAADFNRDGKPDLVLGGPTTQANQVVFLPGNGAGGFGTAVFFNNLDVGNARDFEIADLNADGNLDLIFIGFNSTNNARILLGSGTSSVFTVSNTISSDTRIEFIRAADFNDDGKIDLAMYLLVEKMGIQLGAGNGTFASAGTTNFPGSFGAGLAAADFNNDRKIDFAATDNNEIFAGVNRCGGLTQKPEIDFDGDGKTDITVFRPSSGQWFVLRSSDNSFFGVAWGASTDIPAAGDFDGDLKTDFAVFRPSSGHWFILRSSDNGFTATQFGQNGDQPIVGDYDGDGKADITVFRPSTGDWYSLKSSDGSFSGINWGFGTDIPIR